MTSPSLFIPAHLQILPLRIQPIKHLHTLLIHRKHNPPTHNQPRQPRQRPTPKSQHPLLLKNNRRTPERVPIRLPRLNTLHPRLDRIQRLRHVHRDQPGDTAHAKRRCGAEFLPGRGVPFRQLFEGRVGTEPGRAVGGLARGGGDETLEKTADAALAGDDGDRVEETAQPGVGGFAVVDPG